MARRQVALQQFSPPSATSQAEVTFQATMADELASTVEHLLTTRYAAERLAEEAPAKRAVQTVTSDSLLAELAAARKAEGYQSASRLPEPEPELRGRSPLVRVLALGVIGVVLLVFACMSPFRDYVPAPLREQVDRVIQLLK